MAVCHPAAAHKKLHIPDWYVSSLMLDRALDAILRRLRKLDRSHDVPYLAGYSLDGRTVYIDRHLPKTFKFRGRNIEVDRYLILHEEVEKTLIDQLGLHYLHAHQIATRAEEAAIRADRIGWREYDRFMQRYVKRIGDERLTRMPPDLDLKPYRDEHDFDVLERMRAAYRAGQVPRELRSGKLDKELDAAMAEAKAKMQRPKARAQQNRAPRKQSTRAKSVVARRK